MQYLQTLPRAKCVLYGLHNFLQLSVTKKSMNRAVGIATVYGLNEQGSEFESQQRKKCSLLHNVQTDFGVHPTSCPISIRDSVS
jgi:uncharacterized protein (DUF4213/DUF364 family)